MNILKPLNIFTILAIFFLLALSCHADSQYDAEPEYGPNTGALEVSSSPSGASLYLYNEYEGKTPSSGYLIKSNMNPGEYPLRLNLSGYYDYVIDVKIPRNKIVTVDAVLWPLSGDQTTVDTGNLTIKSNPSKADVLLDDDYKGITPLNLKDVSKGSHNLVVKKDGYSDYSDNISVVPHQTTVISANLTIS